MYEADMYTTAHIDRGQLPRQFFYHLVLGGLWFLVLHYIFTLGEPAHRLPANSVSVPHLSNAGIAHAMPHLALM